MALRQISPGIPTLVVNGVAVGAGVNGLGFGVPQAPNKGPRTVTWRAFYTGGPAAVNVVLQGAINDVDAEYFTLDTTTVVGGETRQVNNVNVRHLRARMVSNTGGTLWSVEVYI